MNEKERSGFIPTSYTERYASKFFIEAVKNGIWLTKDQLMREDK